MRRLHRWCGLIVGLFLAVISSTGVILQVQVLLENHDPAPPALTSDQMPKSAALPGPGKEDHDTSFHETLMHVHSGEFFGKFGNLIGLVCGLALLFFSISGLWMYWQMFTARRRGGHREVFW